MRRTNKTTPQTVGIRLTPEEFAHWHEQAALEKMPLSTWIRRQIYGMRTVIDIKTADRAE